MSDPNRRHTNTKTDITLRWMVVYKTNRLGTIRYICIYQRYNRLSTIRYICIYQIYNRRSTIRYISIYQIYNRLSTIRYIRIYQIYNRLSTIRYIRIYQIYNRLSTIRYICTIKYVVDGWPLGLNESSHDDGRLTFLTFLFLILSGGDSR